jgi:phage gpG-like protein
MTTIKLEMDGLSELVTQLQSMSSQSDDVVSETVGLLARDTEAYAKDSLKDPNKTGRIYTRGSVTHQASDAYQAPANDTGTLYGRIQSELPTPLLAYVGTGLKYGAHLEFGTHTADGGTKMLPRPWLLPAFERAKIGVTKALKEDFERMVKR